MEPSPERKLAAIAAADVVGYSRLMGADETGTHARLKALREQVFEPEIGAFRGRIVKLMGDGILLEFNSVVDALACAVDVQRIVTGRNAALPADQRIEFRIGINLGDVIVDGDDIYGDGVNIAARLEGLAEPGGILISGTAYDQVKNKLALGFEYLGEQSVKNIAEPVRTYRVLPDQPTQADRPESTPRRRARRARYSAAAAILVAAAAALAWWQPWLTREQPAALERMVFALPDKPSIAVLAFENLSGDPSKDYLSDGLSENIITALSRFPMLFVISRQSSFSYKGKPVKVGQVSEELGVRYVLEGSLQISGGQLRVTAQLINALQGVHVWAERYDRPLEDIFAVQDEIVTAIVSTVSTNIELDARERAKYKPPRSLSAYETAALATAHWYKYTEEDNERAGELYQQARELDPDWAQPYRGLAWVNIMRARYGWGPLERERALELALELAHKSIDLAPHNHRMHQALAEALIAAGRMEEGRAAYERALELNPNDTSILAGSTVTLIYGGRSAEAIELLERAIRLNPYGPHWYQWNLAVARYYTGDYQGAVDALMEMKHMPNLARRHLAAAYVGLGRLDQAKAVMAEFMKNDPEHNIAKVRLTYKDKFTNPADLERFIDDLRAAGLPE